MSLRRPARLWPGRKTGPRNVPLPEGTGDDREWRTELPGGMVRIDIGAPIRRLAAEPQPVQVGAGSKPARAPAPEAPPAVPAATPKDPRKTPRRDHRAITRDP